jgi:hypothetical protein
MGLLIETGNVLWCSIGDACVTVSVCAINLNNLLQGVAARGEFQTRTLPLQLRREVGNVYDVISVYSHGCS